MRRSVVVIGALALVAGCSSSGGGSAPSTSAPVSTPQSQSKAAPTHTAKAPSSHAGAKSTSRSSSSAPPVPKGGPVPAKFTPTSVTFVSAGEGWVLGTAPCSDSPCTSIVRTQDGGKTWVGIPAPRASLGNPGDDRADVAVLRFADQRDGWAGVGGLWSTHDGGASWHEQNIGLDGTAVSSIETGGGYVYATVDGCPSQGSSSCSMTTRVYYSPIGHDDWHDITQAFPTVGARPGLVVHGADWYLPSKQGIFHGHGGSTPAKLPTPCHGELSSRALLAVADAQHLDAMCLGQGAAGSIGFNLYGTTDGGHSWHVTGPQKTEPSDVTGIADNTRGVLLVSAASGASVILSTVNDGATFHPVQLNTKAGGAGWSDLGFTTPEQAVVVLDGKGLYLSRDAGMTFAKVDFDG